MDHSGSKILSIRGAQKAHESRIRNEKLQDAQVVELINSVFAHQPAYYGNDVPHMYAENKISIEKAAIPSRDWIAARFYRNYYCRPTLQRDLEGVECDTDFLIETISQFGQMEDRNNLFFLVGPVGCGKTALINYIITRYGTKITSDQTHWFLRYNVHVHFDSTLTLNKLISGLSQKLQMLLERFPRQLHLQTSSLSALNKIKDDLSRISEEASLQHNRAAFVKAVKSISFVLRKKPLIIFDNLDAFFHVRDRYLFLKSKDTGEIKEIKDILSIVNEFFHGQTELGDVGANILFVTRYDTYKILKSSKNIYQGTESCFAGNRNLFSISQPVWSEVVNQRIGLLNEVIEAIASPGYRQKVRSSLEGIIAALAASAKGEGELITGLRELTNFGLRDIMEFISDYTWIPSHSQVDGVDITRRYIEQHPVGMLAYLLHNSKLYSEETTGFPNIYLSNISNEEAQHIASLTDTEPEAWSVHGHSYWIRRLLLAFVYARNARSEPVRVSDVLDVFSRSKKGYCYSENFVRVMLGTMTENHHANLIAVERELSADRSTLIVTEISITPRGRICLENIFDKFYYIQLILDDYELPIPKKCKEKFSYQSGLDYGYLAAEGHEFGVQTRKMILWKAKISVKFAAILSLALSIERVRYEDVFIRLALEGIPVPGEDDLYKSLLHQFHAINRSLARAGAEIDVQMLAEEYEAIRGNAKEVVENAYGF